MAITEDKGAVRNSEVARLGAIAYSTKKKVSPKRWKRIVKDAHGRGFSVNSFLDTSVPGPMKERTKEGIRAEATKTIAKAYAPAEAELSQNEVRTKSIDDKRARDNRYYLDWLTARTGELDTHAKAADQAMLSRGQQIQNEVGAQQAALRNDLVANAGATPGNVSDPHQATAFDVSADQKRNTEAVANQRQVSADLAGSAEKRRASDQAINFAQIAASESRRQADTYNKLKDVADDRTKLALAKGADSSKEIARLLDQEIDKASNNREFGAAMDRLGIQSDSVEQRATAALLSSSDKAKDRRLRASIADRAADQKDRDLDLKGQKLDVDWYRAKHGGSSARKAAGNDPQDRFDRAVALIQSTVFTVPTKDGKDVKTVKDRRSYVAHRRAQIIAQVMKKEKVSREIAERAVAAYLSTEDNDATTPDDPGSYQDWAKKGPATPRG